MPFSNPQSAYETATIKELTDVLLRQLKRPMLNDADLDLSFDVIFKIAEHVDARRPLPTEVNAIQAALVQVIAVSAAWFAEREMTFKQCLLTDMKDMPGWETTAEFLDLANHKSNHELRTASASATLALLGDYQATPALITLLENPQRDDVSAIMARRVLTFVTDTIGQHHKKEWLEDMRAWVAQQTDA